MYHCTDQYRIFIVTVKDGDPNVTDVAVLFELDCPSEHTFALSPSVLFSSTFLIA